MEKAATDEKKRKATATATAPSTVVDSRKRPSSAQNEEPVDTKRPKLDQEPSASTPSFLASFDFTTLPAVLISELIVANLEAFSEPALISLVQTFRQSRGLGTATSPAPSPTPVPSAAPPPISPKKPLEKQRRDAEGTPIPGTPPPVNDEPVDPLQMDIDQDELEFEPDKLNAEVSHPLDKLQNLS
jgi:symplekin